jgi:hypothetical protein
VNQRIGILLIVAAVIFGFFFFRTPGGSVDYAFRFDVGEGNPWVLSDDKMFWVRSDGSESVPANYSMDGKLLDMPPEN